jgi:hypothetical protein
VEPGGQVKQLGIVRVREPREEGSGIQTGVLTKSETVSKLVQENGHQIRLRAVVVVKSQVEIEVSTEVCIDVIIRRKQINARKFIRKRDVIPGAWKRRVGKVTDYTNRACASQHSRAKRGELRANANRNIAVEPCTPNIRGKLEGNQALLAKRPTSDSDRRLGHLRELD